MTTFITIMPEFGGAWGWIREPGAKGVGSCFASDDWWGEDQELPSDLLYHFKKWQTVFEALALDQPEMINWPVFHERGLELCRELREYLSTDIRLFYEKPWEDPDCDTDEKGQQWLSEIMPDGKIRIVPDDETSLIRL